MATTPRIRSRKDGTTYSQVRYRIERDGRTVETSQSFDDHIAAQRWADLLDKVGAVQAERILAAQQAASQDEFITLTEWLRRYANRLTGIEEATRKRYHRYIDRDIDPFFEGSCLPVDALTQDMDAAWVIHLEQEIGNGPKTIHNKHGFLSAAMSAAARQRPKPLVPFNVCAETRLPRIYGAELDYFTDEEYEFIEQLLAPRWRAQFEFSVMSMARPSEVAALTVRDIDPETGAVTINKAYKYTGGKLKLGKPKSVRGVRIVFVPLETVARLDLNRPGSELLFPTNNGTPITVTHFYKQAWMPALKRLRALRDHDQTAFTKRSRWSFSVRNRWQGEDPRVLLEKYGHLIDGLLAKRLTPYTTRHTGISWRLQDGEPIWVVSRDAGHESISTTDRKYGHISLAASAASAQVMAGRLPRLRAQVVDFEQARRRRLVRLGQLGEISPVPNGFEAVWMDAEGIVQSEVFTEYAAAIEHVATYEAGDLLVAA